MRPRARLTLVALAAAAVLATSPTSAHHGFTGRYDVSQPLWLEGEVTRIYFGQPHPVVTLRTSPALALPTAAPDLAGAGDVIAEGALAVRPDTLGRELTVEFPPIQAFFALARSVMVGDRVAVIAFRNCDAPYQLRGQWIRLRTSTPVAISGRVQYQVEAC